jgi:hypothetical protein
MAQLEVETLPLVMDTPSSENGLAEKPAENK